MNLFAPVQFRFEIVDELSSTNSFLLEQSQRDDFHGRAIMARRQTAGIGRRGRSWSTLDGNLALSFGVLLSKSEHISLLPFLTGIALYDTIQKSLPKDAALSLKWPNDIYLNKKKLGGMLSQAKQQGSEIRLVVGIGLNIAEAPLETRVPAIALAEVVAECPSAETIAIRFLQNLENAFANFSRAEQLCAEWEQRCAHIGKEIHYFSPESSENKRRAIALHLLQSGELMVLESNGEKRNLSGEEVSLELLL